MANTHFQAQPPTSSEDGRSPTTSLTGSSRETFYSNKDIEILYDIVVAAQERLDNDPHSSSLPAASLFKAYDAVLPRYGIDPDDDHHLSALVFRIGGERGDGTLVDKFQAILGRMGIVLEHDEDVTVSPRASQSASESRAKSPSSPIEHHKPSYEVEDVTIGDERSLSTIPAASEAEGNRDVYQPANDAEIRPVSPMEYEWMDYVDQHSQQHAQGHDFPGQTSQSEYGSNRGVPSFRNANEHINLQDQQRTESHESADEGRRSALIAALDRWRTTSTRESSQSQISGKYASRQTQTHMGRAPLSFGQTEQKDEHDDFNMPRTKEVLHTQGPTDSATKISVTRFGLIDRQRQSYLSPIKEATSSVSVPHVPPTIVSEVVQDFQPISATPLAQGDAHSTDAQLLARAARAREIHLASKVFNHWADRTARRLEREAVARRHMLRFRYFRGWSQVPSTRLPDTEHLRSVTALQKLRRAVSQQEEQFKKAALAIAHSHRIDTISRVCGWWLSDVKSHVGMQKTMAQAKARTLTKWTAHSSEGVNLGRAIKYDKMRRDGVDGLRKWQADAEWHHARASAAQDLCDSRLVYSHLREWWDQVEAERRAAAWRHRYLVDRAKHAFNEWNLRARAQAFVWKTDYLSVSRCFDVWQAKTSEHKLHERQARHVHKSACVSKYGKLLISSAQQDSALAQLHDRAFLYISAMRVLDTFDSAVKRRRNREREYVRRYLMVRYTQVSSQRKRRNFFSTLDRWRSSTRQALEDEHFIEASLEAETIQRKELALAAWRRRVATDLELQRAANVQRVSYWLFTWNDFSNHLEKSDLEAWDTWVSRNQHEYLKEWSIASMQGGGQAHTATVVRQKHDREKRAQTLQLWKQTLKGKASMKDAIPLRRTPPPTKGLANSWRGSLMARSLARRTPQYRDPLASIMETPTRSTGLPLSVENKAEAWDIPPLLEEHEDIELAPEPAEAINPLANPILRREGNLHLGLPSTTPRAPVPLHLQREDNSHLPGSEQKIQSKFNPPRSTFSRLPIGSAARDVVALRKSVAERLASQSATQRSTPNFSKTQPAKTQQGTPELFAPAMKSQLAGDAPRYSQDTLSRLSTSTLVNSVGPRSPWRVDISGQLPSELSSDGKTAGMRRNIQT